MPAGVEGGATSVVQSQPNPPQLLPEAREGFNQAQQFYRGILTNPPQYTDQRLAPVTQGQQAGISQAYDYFGAPQNYQLGAENQLTQTSAGGYLGGPEAQRAVESLSDPIFRRFRDETLPQIRDRSQFAGQGVDSARRGIANENAIQNLGQQLALSAYAPVYNQERDRMMQAAQLTPTMLGAEALRLGQLSAAGGAERGFNQQVLDTARQIWEEPLFRQGGAASSLLSAAGYGPGASTTTTETTQRDSAGSQVAGLGHNLILAAALFGGGFGNR